MKIGEVQGTNRKGCHLTVDCNVIVFELLQSSLGVLSHLPKLHPSKIGFIHPNIDVCPNPPSLKPHLAEVECMCLWKAGCFPGNRKNGMHLETTNCWLQAVSFRGV